MHNAYSVENCIKVWNDAYGSCSYEEKVAHNVSFRQYWDYLAQKDEQRSNHENISPDRSGTGSGPRVFLKQTAPYWISVRAEALIHLSLPRKAPPSRRWTCQGRCWPCSTPGQKRWDSGTSKPCRPCGRILPGSTRMIWCFRRCAPPSVISTL